MYAKQCSRFSAFASSIMKNASIGHIGSSPFKGFGLYISFLQQKKEHNSKKGLFLYIVWILVVIADWKRIKKASKNIR